MKLRSDFARKLVEEHGFDEEFLRRPMKRHEAYDLCGHLTDAVKALQARVDELEASGARFRGVYQRAATYRRGDQATHRGSLWTALGDVPEGTVPGENPTHWQLAAKGIG